MAPKYATVDEFISSFPTNIQVILQNVRKAIKEAVPGSVDGFSYGVPTTKLNDKNLIIYSAFKNHLGIYPTPEVIENFSKELKGYKQSKGAIQFQFDAPIDYELIKKLAIYRAKLIRADKS